MADWAIRLWIEDEGQGLAEYVLVLALMSFLSIISMKTVASTLSELYTDTAGRVSRVYVPATENHDHEDRSRQSNRADRAGWSAATASGSGESIQVQQDSDKKLLMNGVH